MSISRRQLIANFGLAAIATQLPSAAQTNSYLPSLIKPPRLNINDTVGLINPAAFSYPQEIEPIKQILSQLGLKVKLGTHIFDRYGYLGGKDPDRAADVNAMFADSSVQAILTVQGGWGCNRILPLLDYQLIRNHPKIIMGFSDITSLLLAIYARSGVVTFHGPVGISTWSQFTVDSLKQVLFNPQTITLQNSSQIRVQTITPGKNQGKLVGGNLSVLAAMVGSDYLPDWKNSILFVEEVGEEVYRIDRMLTQLKLAGILNVISGFIFGQCNKCEPEQPQESLTLEQVLFEHIRPLNIPAWYGSMIGHIRDIFTLPIGTEVEIDAVAGTIKLLEPAVT
ncbi:MULTISPECIES: S66 peptidase family protein [Kamptonema]|uniref:S66 peptidase family protein n=1 Tax=Kamptonema TaxID=1501433 RepID=UPI0001DAD13C|nr:MULTISPECIES: LD-carboxypeptidase [Kamptonema]CBN59368.1 Peptidase U61, LD-carboxypeptidase A [Kamptonema sp. PCC 6506]